MGSDAHIVPHKLDLSTATPQTHAAWERSFLAFCQEAEINQYDWASQKTAIETAPTDETSAKIEALRLQMPDPERQDFSKILALIKDTLEGTTTIWVRRLEFHQLEQNPGESARQLFTKVVTKAAECDFRK